LRSVSKPNANQAAATARTLDLRSSASFIVVSECQSAINRKASLLPSLASSIAGLIAPKMFPKWGIPVLCIPVKILAILSANLGISSSSTSVSLNLYHKMVFLKFDAMIVDNALIDKLANLSKLEFDEESKEGIKKDLTRMLAFVEQLNELNTDGVEPLIHVNEETNKFREDIVTEELSQKDALKNAPEHDGFYFKVPKVVENPDLK
jgi:aspartyl-tRNA(Asn)/glutamyl-tRNA(Gln) amidotransferase subunit C